MRERLARILAALSAVIVVVLSAVFSLLHNTPAQQDASGDARQASQQTRNLLRTAAGRAIFDQHGCGGCHSIAGQGNPRVPLDGVGKRRSPEELRDWIVAAESVRPSLSASVVKRKQTYAALPEQELQALVDYLSGLQSAAESRVDNPRGHSD